MAYDAVREEMVLFGGQTQAGVRLGDTWTWDGQDWTQEMPANSPSPRANARMAFDASSGQMLLVGGQPNTGILGETWRWDGSTWTELSPATPAPERFNPSIAYDPGMQAVLLFGGSNTSGDSGNSTWSWNGTTWTQLFPPTSPSPRWGAPMAYDTESGEMVLFGGMGDNGGFVDTWTWNGTTRSQETPAGVPPPSYGMPMAYSPVTESVIKLSGSAAETWGWDGSDWSRVNTQISPPASVNSVMALDEARDEVVLFGGFTMEGPVLGDTWTFGLQEPPPKQQPHIVATAVVGKAELGEPIRFGIWLNLAQSTEGTTVFRAYGPSETKDCSGNPAFTSEPVASSAPDDPRFVSPDFVPETPGKYHWQATFTGDENYLPVTSECGASGATSTVTNEPAPVCPKTRGGIGLETFRLVPPLGNSRPVPGFRIMLRVKEDLDAKITSRITFRTSKGTFAHTFRTRTVRVDRDRKLRFQLPGRASRWIRKSGERVYGKFVNFRLIASLKAHGAGARCFERTATRVLRIPVTTVSSRVALRRR